MATTENQIQVGDHVTDTTKYTPGRKPNLYRVVKVGDLFNCGITYVEMVRVRRSDLKTVNVMSDTKSCSVAFLAVEISAK